MKNNLVDCLGAIWDFMENEAVRFDVLVSDADDGESHPMHEAKQEAINELEVTIASINQFLADMKKMPITALRKKYNL